MPKFDEQKKILDRKTPSDNEVWVAVRYLDIKIDDKPGTRNAIIAVALLMICATVCLLRACSF